MKSLCFVLLLLMTGVVASAHGPGCPKTLFQPQFLIIIPLALGIAIGVGILVGYFVGRQLFKNKK